MDYEKKYEQALKVAREYKQKGYMMINVALGNIFPELKESEDEKIRKILIDHFKRYKKLTENCNINTFYGIPTNDILSWLEKQGDVTKLSEDEQNQFAKGVLISCSDSFVKYLDAHKRDGQMCVSNGECEDIENSFLNGMWDRLHRYYCKYIKEHNNLSEATSPKFWDDTAEEAIERYETWLVRCGMNVKEQGEQKPADKVEPKFKVGDWITEGYNLWRIIGIKQLEYILQSPAVNDYIPFVDKTFHLWTIHDAKDGDLIYVSTELKGIQAIFHKFENGIIYFHCSLCSDFTQGGYMPIGDVELVNPLLQTQHQRFFQKMKEAGYEWDAEKKVLKEIEL